MSSVDEELADEQQTSETMCISTRVSRTANDRAGHRSTNDKSSRVSLSVPCAARSDENRSTRISSSDGVVVVVEKIEQDRVVVSLPIFSHFARISMTNDVRQLLAIGNSDKHETRSLLTIVSDTVRCLSTHNRTKAASQLTWARSVHRRAETDRWICRCV
jgi:hypothetical protein